MVIDIVCMFEEAPSMIVRFRSIVAGLFIKKGKRDFSRQNQKVF